MTTKLARILIEYLNRHWPYICRDVVIPSDAHIHRKPVKKRAVKSLSPVEIVASNGLTFNGFIAYNENLAPIDIFALRLLTCLSDGLSQAQAEGHDFGGQI